jgi:hypothetical protein
VHFGTVGGGGIGFDVVGGVGADVTGADGDVTAPPPAGKPVPAGAGLEPAADPCVAEPEASPAPDAIEPDDPLGPVGIAVGPTAPATVAFESRGPPSTLPYGSR